MHHDSHQHQHRRRDVELQLRDGEHDEQQRQRRRHEQPEHVAAGVHHVADDTGVPGPGRAAAGSARRRPSCAPADPPSGRDALHCAALRSSRLSLGPANDFRRARASAEVIGAGATGPLRRAASLRLGVGRPLGAVVADPREVREPDEERIRGFRRCRHRPGPGGAVLVFLTAQQFHARQVTSQPPGPAWSGTSPCLRRWVHVPAP